MPDQSSHWGILGQSFNTDLGFRQHLPTVPFQSWTRSSTVWLNSSGATWWPRQDNLPGLKTGESTVFACGLSDLNLSQSKSQSSSSQTEVVPVPRAYHRFRSGWLGKIVQQALLLIINQACPQSQFRWHLDNSSLHYGSYASKWGKTIVYYLYLSWSWCE